MQFSSEGRLAFLLAIDCLKIYLEVYPKCNVRPMSIFPDITIKTLTWYFIGVSYDYATGLILIRLSYPDGSQLDNSFSVGVIELETHHDIWLGYGPESPGALSGSMACVQIYNIPLNNDQVTEAKKMCLPAQWSGKSKRNPRLQKSSLPSQ